MSTSSVVILSRLILGATRGVVSRGREMYSVHDWAEVRRLHLVGGMSKAAIAARLG